MDKLFRLLFITLFVIISLNYCSYGENYVSAQTNQTASKLQAANNAVNQAFNAVLDAEKAGANVTALLVRLNYAENILAQAENSNRTGDFNATAARADSVLPIAQQVTTQALNAKQTSTISGRNAFMFTIAFNVLGPIIFVLALFLVWSLIKRHHIKNLSCSKPEMNSQ
jgi:hypothetical protein